MISNGRRNKALIRNVVFTSLSLALVAGLTVFFLSKPFETKAISLSNFNPGNIISDYTMSNVNTMSVEEIQRFLSEHGNCNDTDTYVASWYPNTRYHIKDGHFVCMADERFGAGTAYGDDLKEGEGQTAAEIIYEVAHQYNINPQVLIVLLEKEQGLVSDSWPNGGQYATATGFGCPDTAACDSQYFGLKNQLTSAAKLFREVLDGGWTNYPVGPNYVAYNPTASCGGSVINIENRATSSLYRYTPYQPNQGALDAVYGTSYCGSYGNRNFYLYFLSWFGDPAGGDGIVTSVAKDEDVSSIDERVKEISDTVKLGNKLDGEFCYWGRNDNRYCVQRFENGYIISGPNGAWESYGEIRNRWAELGYEGGVLGYPAGGVEKKDDGTSVQKYDNGYIISGPNGVWESYGPVRERWGKLGYGSGTLGYMMDGMFCYTNSRNGNDYCVQRYDNGYIISGPNGAWESYGEIRNRWAELGYENGILGYPIDEVYCYKNAKNSNDYCVQRYDNGYIISGPNGAWESYGEIRNRWAELGYENGILGYPMSDVYCYKNSKNGNDYCVQRYDNGYIISGPNGAWESYGVIRDYWASTDYERGRYGYPKGPVVVTSTSYAQLYDSGTITIDKK